MTRERKTSLDSGFRRNDETNGDGGPPIDVARVQALVNGWVTDKRRAKELADLAGLSPAAVSLFRNDKYPGARENVARRLLRAIQEDVASRAIKRAEWRQAGWIVNTGKNVRLVKQNATLQALLTKYPEAHVMQVWIGTEPKDIHFVGVKP